MKCLYEIMNMIHLYILTHLDDVVIIDLYMVLSLRKGFPNDLACF